MWNQQKKTKNKNLSCVEKSVDKRIVNKFVSPAGKQNMNTQHLAKTTKIEKK